MLQFQLSAIAKWFLQFGFPSLCLLVFGANSWSAPMGTAYVANTGSDTISILSLTANSVVNTVSVGDAPRYVAFTPNGSRAYVTNMNSDSVSVIDTALQSVIDTINVGDQPEQIVVTRNGLRAYVANSNSASVSVIDVPTNTVIDTLTTAANPASLALHPTRDELWIGMTTVGTQIEARSLADHSILGTATSLSRIFAGTDLAFWPDGSMAIGSEGCGFCGRFHKISGDIVAGTISPIQQDILFDNLGGARGVAVNPNPLTDVGYLAKIGQNGGASRVVELGGAGRTYFSGDPREMAVSEDGAFVFLTQLTQGGANPGSVAVIDAATFANVTTIPVGLVPHGIAIQPVPEPTTIVSLAMGLVAALCIVRRDRTRVQP